MATTGMRIFLALTLIAALAVPWLVIAYIMRYGSGVVPSSVIWVIAGSSLALIGIGVVFFIMRSKLPVPSELSIRGRVIGAIAAPLVYLALMALMAAWRGGSLVAQLMGAVPMVLMFTGIGFLNFAWRRTKGEKHCAKCGYELSPAMEPELSADSRCPECGSFWLRPGGTTEGRVVIHKPLLALGILLLILPLAGMAAKIGSGWMRAAPLKFLPTSSLIAEVVAAPRGFTMDEWAELSTRMLSREQSERLARGLIDLRSNRKQYLAREADAWLEAAAAAGTLPPDLIEPYYRGMLGVWIDAPDRARAGEPVSIGLGSEHKGSLATPALTSKHVYVAFAGFGADGLPPVQARSDRYAYGLQFGRVYRAFGKTNSSTTPGPQTEMVWDAPGKHTITAEVWIAVAMHSPPSMAIDWTQAGEPSALPGSVWLEKRTLSKEIIVEPASAGNQAR